MTSPLVGLAADCQEQLSCESSTRLSPPVQLAEVQLRQGQQHTALHAMQVPGRSKPAAKVSCGTPGAEPARRCTATSHASARRAAVTIDLAIVAHHESVTLLQQATAAGGGHAPHTLSSWLSFFTVQHQACEDAANDQYVRTK
jgi:hypothetical protein